MTHGEAVAVATTGARWLWLQSHLPETPPTLTSQVQDRLPPPVARCRISSSTQPLWLAPILRAASSQYSASISAPTKKRSSSLAATAVVPEPQKGSKMRSSELGLFMRV